MHRPLPPPARFVCTLCVQGGRGRCIALAPYGSSLVAGHPNGGLGKAAVLGFSFSCICASDACASLWEHFPIVAVELSAGVKSQFGDLQVFCKQLVGHAEPIFWRK